MGIEMSGGGVGDMLWKGANTLLGAAGTAMGATALGVKANASHFNRCGEKWGSYNDCGCGCNGYGNGYGYNGYGVNRFELLQNQEISRLQAKEYSDVSDLKLFDDYTTKMNAEKDRVNGRFEIIFGELVASRERLQAEVCKLDKEMALNKQAMEFGFASANKEFENINCRLDAITKEVIPLSAICPQPLSSCVPVGFTGQVVTTTPTTDTSTVFSNRTSTASATGK
jgi:hypothetical protein